MLRNIQMTKLTSSIVKNLNQIESLTNSALGYSKLSGKFRLSTIFWFVVIFACIFGLVFQTYLRIDYFYQYPVAVDVQTKFDGQIPFPPLMICTYDTPQIIKLFSQYKSKLPLPDIFNFNCINPFYTLMQYSNLSIADIYSAARMQGVQTDFEIKKKRKDVTININRSYVMSPFGTCILLKLEGNELPTFAGSSVSVKLYRPIKNECSLESPYYTSSVPYMSVLTLANGVTQVSGSKMNVWFGKTIYSFINTPKEPCVDEKTFYNCLTECVTLYLKDNLTCRFPFTMPSIDKPHCEDRKEAAISYMNTLNIHGELDFINDCHCTKKCEELTHNLNAEAFLIEGLTSTSKPCDDDSPEVCFTQIQLLFPGLERSEFKERRVYFFSSLMADFGANLGLFLSLSALSLVDNLQNYFKLWKLKQNIKNVTKNRKILQKYKTTVPKVKKLTQYSGTSLKIKIDLIKILYYVLFFASILIAYRRLRLYWDEPITTTVVIERAVIMEFPDMTVCGEVETLYDYRNNRSRETNRDSCQLQPWELVDKLPADEIWNYLTLKESFMEGIDIFKYYGTPSRNKFLNKTVDLPIGKCTKFMSIPTRFRGCWSMGNIVIVKAGNDDTTCAKTYIQYYITPPGNPIDVLSVNTMPFDKANGLWIKEKRVRHVNLKTKPCVKNHIHFKCVEECFEKNILTVLNDIGCRLPYMKYNTFPLCKTTKTALKAHYSYLKTYQNSKLVSICKCTKRCNETYYETRVYNPQTVEGIVFLNYFFQTNLIETYEEVLAYTLSTFVGDIGSILGVMVGFSLLSFFDYVEEVPGLIKTCLRKSKKLVGF